MKLILTQEVTGLGAPGDVVEVKDGYGRNYLVPRGFAIRWTRGGEKQIDSIKKARAVRDVRDLDHAEEIKATARGLDRSTCQVRAGDGGRLFGAVTVADIADAVTRPAARVDKRRIVVGNPIKSLGAHQVTVKVHDERRPPPSTSTSSRPEAERPRPGSTGTTRSRPRPPGGLRRSRRQQRRPALPAGPVMAAASSRRRPASGRREPAGPGSPHAHR